MKTYEQDSSLGNILANAIQLREGEKAFNECLNESRPFSPVRFPTKLPEPDFDSDLPALREDYLEDLEDDWHTDFDYTDVEPFQCESGGYEPPRSPEPHFSGDYTREDRFRIVPNAPLGHCDGCGELFSECRCNAPLDEL
jgi:hypothetical protein